MKGFPVALALLLATISFPTIGKDRETDAGEYIIDENVLIATRDGAHISAFTVRRHDQIGPLPTVLSFGIYTYPWLMDRARRIADRGYVAVQAYTRGKRYSPDPVVPYEHDGADAYDVIDWIAHQPWSNGEVGMYGGSYLGFVQWSAVRGGVHPALKTIVPQVPVAPGIDYPMEHNVFWTGNTLPWTYYVTNHRGLDEEYYGNREHWNDLYFRWYETGAAYRELDRLNDRPSPLFHRWLDHPAYDAYWRSMIPQGEQYRRIDIPVLATTGYYDGGQISALHYFREHYANNPDAEHYLVIGPYDHRSGQHSSGETVSNYTFDPVARVNMGDLALEWLDHVLKGAPRPALVRDRINYQVMGDNAWRHAPSIAAMSNDELVLHLDSRRLAETGWHLLAREPAAGATRQVIDLADRSDQHNYFTWRILHEELVEGNGVVFRSEPLEEAVLLNGVISGTVNATINKRDFDLTLAFYEQMPDGSFFYLTYYRGRASYAADPGARRLLTPGGKTSIPVNTGRLVSRRLSAGSRLVVVANGNKHPFEQINYGTGRDVSDESMADADEPLEILWHGDSVIRFPLWRGTANARP